MEFSKGKVLVPKDPNNISLEEATEVLLGGSRIVDRATVQEELRCPNCWALPHHKHAWGCRLDPKWNDDVAQLIEREKEKIFNSAVMEEHF